MGPSEEQKLTCPPYLSNTGSFKAFETYERKNLVGFTTLQ